MNKKWFWNDKPCLLLALLGLFEIAVKLGHQNMAFRFLQFVKDNNSLC